MEMIWAKEDMEEEMNKRKDQKELLRSVMAQCDKWIRLAHHKWVDDGRTAHLHLPLQCSPRTGFLV